MEFTTRFILETKCCVILLGKYEVGRNAQTASFLRHERHLSGSEVTKNRSRLQMRRLLASIVPLYTVIYISTEKVATAIESLLVKTGVFNEEQKRYNFILSFP